MMAVCSEALLSLACRVLGVARSTVYCRPRKGGKKPGIDRELCGKIEGIIERFPSFGIRRVWAWLRDRTGLKVNRKKAARLMRLKGWTLKQRREGHRPWADVSASVATRPEERWATDVGPAFCGERDGWRSLVAVMDCCAREVLGWEAPPTARAKSAERALEVALLNRFGWVG